MHNEKLSYLLSVKKLAPDHIKLTDRADVFDSKFCAILSAHPL